MFLLDTCAVADLRRHGRPAHETLAAWAASTPAGEQFLSALTIMELERGVRLMERRDADQGLVLRRWFDGRVLTPFEGRILPVDIPVARAAAALHVPDPQSIADALIAATAQVHGLTVVTRNVDDFTPMGVPLLNPWRQTPGQASGGLG